MGNKSSKEGGSASQSQSGNNAAMLDDEDNSEQTPEQLSYYQMMKQGYQELVNAIIRPPRCKYTTAHLGPPSFEFGGKIFQRTDTELRNPRGYKIVCSMWEPKPEFRLNPVLPCVIYMHGNSSARLEGIPQLSLVLSLGATLLSFDFCGSGLSEGDYVSLGAFEKEDLKCVIEYLRSTGTTSTIALWGRSMGAATALLHGERDPSLAGMVLDSSFADLTMLAEEMVEKGRKHGLFAPSIIVKIAIRFIRSSVMKAAGFDIKTLSPIERADKCFIPALFVAAEGDEFVPPHHSKKIYDKYSGDKNIVIVEGDHNSPRPKYLLDSVSIFLIHTLQIPESWMMPDANHHLGLPPWQNRNAHQKKKPSYAHKHPESTKLEMPGAKNAEEIGMTNELQADVRAKLFRALGDRGAVAAATSAAAPSVAASASATSPSSSEQPVGSDAQFAEDINAVHHNFLSELEGDHGFDEFGIYAKDYGDEDAFDAEDYVPDECFESDNAPGTLATPLRYPSNPAVTATTTTSKTRSARELIDGQEIHLQALEDDSEWECTTCTLINTPDAAFCSVCAMPRDGQ